MTTALSSAAASLVALSSPLGAKRFAVHGAGASLFFYLIRGSAHPGVGGRRVMRELVTMSELLSILARTSPLETPSGARRSVVAEALGCWTEEEIAALLESSSGDRPTALRDSHLGVCPECRDLVLVACL